MPYGRQLFVGELKRILKPNGRAYLSLGAGPPFGFMNRDEWENMLDGFKLEQEGSWQKKWAVVSIN